MDYTICTIPNDDYTELYCTMAAPKSTLLDYTILHFTEEENGLHYTINTLKYTTPSKTTLYYCIALHYVILCSTWRSGLRLSTQINAWTCFERTRPLWGSCWDPSVVLLCHVLVISHPSVLSESFMNPAWRLSPFTSTYTLMKRLKGPAGGQSM